MKIYNEVITQFNDLTGQWETIYEDSEQYNGYVALAQGLPSNATAISSTDTIADTIKTTAGYFTNGDGTLSGTDIHTGSLADSNEKYYFNVTQAHTLSSSAEVQFAVAFGDIRGSGSNQYGDSTTNATNVIGATQAIYKQFTSLLLEETEASGGFKISQQGSSGQISTGVRDDYIYMLIGKRARFKDRINKKVWTLTLSGSDAAGLTHDRTAAGGGAGKLYLTDDSKNVAAIATPGGPRHNIVSGTLGTPKTPATTRTFGWFYPEMGCMVFSGAELSASLSGHADGTDMTASFSTIGGEDPSFTKTCGFGPNLYSGQRAEDKNNAANALRFVNCMRSVGGTNTLRMRSEEDQTQENYFCRIKADSYNFSANPTFVSGGLNKIRHTSMQGNPTTFISGLGLYNSAGQLLATAKLSSPLKKNFASEATIKVKLTY